MEQQVQRLVKHGALTPNAAFIKLLTFPMEACGLYARNASDPAHGPCTFELEPIQSPEKIVELLDDLEGIRGLRRARRAASLVQSPRLAVLDSWVTAGALEFLLRRARALADGGCSLDEIVDDLTELRGGTRIVFSVPDMEALSRSGRLGAIRRAVATKLNRYPVMALQEGGIVKLSDGRGARGMAAEMVDRVPGETSDLVISHFGPRGDEAREVFLAARTRFPEARIRVKDGGPVLAGHLGVGAVGLAWA